jgi:hypothetical protein
MSLVIVPHSVHLGMIYLRIGTLFNPIHNMLRYQCTLFSLPEKDGAVGYIGYYPLSSQKTVHYVDTEQT